MSLAAIDIDVEGYLDTGEQLASAIAGLTAEQLKWKGAPGQWSVTEVLAHLADHHIVVSFRIRDILADTNVRLPAFNQDAWVAGQHANDGRAEDILNAFKALLTYNALLLRRLTPADADKTGVNAQGAILTVPLIVAAFIKHVQTHLAQIARTIQGELGSRNSGCAI